MKLNQEKKKKKKFYKDLIVLCKRKGYTNVQVVLTRIDVFEKNEFNRNKNLSQSEKNTKLNKSKDFKIEKVIQALE